ncbi:tetratricopeptide repeat protein [Castellaniella sp. UC4442_H9]|jgi:TPR repeat protein
MRSSRIALESGVLGTVLCVALQCLPGTVRAAAVDAFLQSDFKDAFAQYQGLAKQGSSNAQAMLGAMLQDGVGADVSVEDAASWFRKAADAGNSVGENGLGYMHDKGRGVGIDFALAAKLYDASAQRGFPRAKFNLGVMYDLGQGVPRDHAQAFKWYLSAAQNGFVPAQNSVGGMYALGEGVKKDGAQAVYWFRLAASSGRDVRALGNLGAMYALGAGVEKDPATAVAFYEKAAAAKDPNADFNLGLMYLKGNGVDRDMSRALKLFEQAAKNASERARATLGLMYATGFGVEKANPMQAVTLLLTAANNADQNESKSCDLKAASSLETYRTQAEGGSARAQYCLGMLYTQGLEGALTADPVQAAQWLQAAAKQGDPGAQYRVGVAAMQKAASPWQSPEAIHWFLASALHQRPESVPSTAAEAQAFLEKSDPSVAFSLVTTPTSVHDLLPGQILASALAPGHRVPKAARSGDATPAASGK